MSRKRGQGSAKGRSSKESSGKGRISKMSRSTVRGGGRLAQEISPYLRSQATDPVQWYPWGEEALRRAQDEDKPIFLSVGYAACRWCHVMARESFRDTTMARFLNEHFINIKVDREERPDIDEVYMAATQIYSHGGGWPNTVFLTPDGRPYFCGTFFPLEDGSEEAPGFRSVAESMAHAWSHRRGDVLEQAEELADVMRHFLSDRGEAGEIPGPEMVAAALGALAERFDDAHGGFGTESKFPMPASLLLLLELADGVPEADAMLRRTLEHMARGGIHDVLGGGFHRYATDRAWRRPHFEKLLADNGWLLYLYARQALRGDAQAKEVCRRLADFLCRDLGAPEGAFFTAIDGETAGIEGASYLWTLGQLVAVLGQENASFLAPFLGYDGEPLMEEQYVLRWQLDLSEQAARRRLPVEQLRGEVEPLIARLAAARQQRPQPLVDDKILCDANGVVIAGLAWAATALEDDTLLRRAAQAADWLWQHLRGEDGRLRHAHGGGRAEAAEGEDGQRSGARFGAFLNDYACLLWGLLALAERDDSAPWLQRAEALADEMVSRLADPSEGGLWNAEASPQRPFRSKEIFDGTYPASNGLALMALLELDRLSGRPAHRPTVEGALRAFAAPAQQQVEGLRSLAVVVHRWHQGQSP